MKSSKIRGGVVLAMAVLLSTAAFAGSKPGSLYLSEATQLNGKQIPAGTYQVRWEGSGPAVQVSVLRGKKVIASAPAKVERVTSTPDRGAAVIDTAGGGRTLVEARFAGKNYKLVFPSPEAQAQNMHNGSNQSNR
ncbi:MAG TPA: hypothetical protein VJQ50_06560 [Terriglobales bacterium]|jgi:hypothetical protein|nr:hypothetical protein [Terriglobales bacterium]